MTKTLKRPVAMLLAVLMVIGCLGGVTAGATDSTPQIVNEGDTYYFKLNNDQTDVIFQESKNADTVLTMSKTITGTTTENVFDVQLQVSTTEDIQKIPGKTPDCAVVLVIDISSSMNYCAHCAYTSSHTGYCFSTCTVCGQTSSHSNHKSSTLQNACPNDSGAVYKAKGGAGSDRNNCVNCGFASSAHSNKTIPADHAFVQDTTTYQSRIAQAKAAAIEFIDTFANDTGAAENDKRLVQIVSFGSNVSNATGNVWYDVNTTTGLSAINGIINGLTVPTGNGTNIEGGLMLARNILNAGRSAGRALENIGYLYTVLLTDGTPTFYMSSNNASTTNTTSLTGTQGGGSASNSTDVKGVPSVANDIKAIGAAQGVSSQLFSICYGASGGTSVYDTTSFSNVNGNSSGAGYYVQVYGTNKAWKDVTIGEWLSHFSNAAYKATDDASLFEAFSAISDVIRLAAKAWTVTDIMGDDIKFIGVNNPGPVSVTQMPSDTNGNTLVWNVKSSTASPSAVGGVNWYTYTLSYKVRLDNLGAEEGDEFNTNESAILEFLISDPDGGYIYDGESCLKQEFAKPIVESLFDYIEFTKVNDVGEQLNGAEFELSHADNCACGLSGTYGDTAVSVNGKVTFANVPSGHSYTIVETATAAGHVLDSAPINASVAWGEAAVGLEGGKFVNDRETHDVTIIYHVNGAEVARNTDFTDYKPGDAYAAEIADYLYASYTYGQGQLEYGFLNASYSEVNGVTYTSIANLKAALVNMGSGNVTINLYYDNPNTVQLQLTKEIKLAKDDMTWPVEFTFTFNLYADGIDTPVAELMFTNEDFDTDNNELVKTKSFTWLAPYATIAGKTLTIKEVISGAGWTSDLVDGRTFVTIDGDNAPAITKVTNTYTQTWETPYVKAEKYFTIGEDLIENFRGGMGLDGAKYNCAGHEVYIDHVCDDELCDEECDQDGYYATEYGTDCGPECYEYTFNFKLQKANNGTFENVPDATVPLTRTGANILALAASGDNETIMFAVSEAGDYRIVEDGTYTGWALADEVTFNVNAYGDVSYGDCDMTMDNIYGGASLPSITISKTLKNERTSGNYTATEELEFEFELYDLGSFSKTVQITIPAGEYYGSVKVYLEAFYGVDSATLKVSELSDSAYPGFKYDTDEKTITITDGVVDSTASFAFVNTYTADKLYPEIGIVKSVYGAEVDEATDFTFSYTIDGTEGQTYVTYVKGETSFKKLSLIENFTGIVTITEEALINGAADADKEWVFDATEHVFTFLNGELYSYTIGEEVQELSTTAAFSNGYKPAEVELTKASNVEGSVKSGAEVTFTLTVKNTGTQTVRIDEITDTLFPNVTIASVLYYEMGEDNNYKEAQTIASDKYGFDEDGKLVFANGLELAASEQIVVTYTATVSESFNNEAVVIGKGTETGKEVGGGDEKFVEVYDPDTSASKLTKTVYNAIYNGGDNADDVAAFIKTNSDQTAVSFTGLSSGTTSIDVIFKVEISDPDGLLNPVSYGDSFKNGTLTFIGVLADGVIVENYADAAAAIADLGTNITLIYKGTVTVTGTTNTTYYNVAAIGFNKGIDADDLTASATVTVSRRSGGGYTPPTGDDPTEDITETDVPLTETPDEPTIDIIEEDPPLIAAPQVSEVVITEEAIPLDDAPQTGDTGMLVFLLIMMTLSAGGLFLVTRKTTRNNTKTR